MDLKTDFSKNQITLLTMSSLEYNDAIVNIMKQLTGNTCYVTTNKTYDSLKEIFQKNKINTKNIIFLDSISKSLKKTQDNLEDVYFVSSPGALTELSLVIDKFLKQGFDYLIFDSLTNLSIYQNKNICSKFIIDLISKIKKTKTKAILYALESKDQEDVINKVGGMVDKVIKLDSKK